MIREYAFDPDVAVTDTNTLQRFFSEFGAEYGRVIGEVPNKWKEDLVRKIQGMGMSAGARRNCLDQLAKLARTGVVRRDTKRIGDDDWLDRALSLHAITAFNAILTDAEDLANSQFNYFDMLESSPDDWVIEQTKGVPRNAVSLADSIANSLGLSKTIFFVDRYFDPLKEESRAPFIEYIRRCTNGRIATNKIYVHTSEINHEDLARRKNRADIERGMTECIQPLLPSGFTVELWVWPINKIHDRFILTNMVGYAFGHGLSEDQYRDAIEVNVNRLGDSARAKQFRYFSTEANRIGDAILVVGS